jgi:8-oxo-dGTP pyrophosphatase MutT (NUDIX family)
VGGLPTDPPGSSRQRRPGAVARLRATTATSAGGIVIRESDGRPQLVIGRRRRERDSSTWTLPKGTPVPGETLEQTAVREVGEETGLRVRITGPLDSIHYRFVQSGTRISKTVHYFLMEPIGGDLVNHDHEFDEVRWLDFAEAQSLLTFETERALVTRAGRVLAAADAAGGPSSGGPVEPDSAGIEALS